MHCSPYGVQTIMNRTLLKQAASLPVGHPERKRILAQLKLATNWERSFQEYLTTLGDTLFSDYMDDAFNRGRDMSIEDACDEVLLDFQSQTKGWYIDWRSDKLKRD